MAFFPAIGPHIVQPPSSSDVLSYAWRHEALPIRPAVLQLDRPVPLPAPDHSAAPDRGRHEKESRRILQRRCACALPSRSLRLIPMRSASPSRWAASKTLSIFKPLPSSSISSRCVDLSWTKAIRGAKHDIAVRSLSALTPSAPVQKVIPTAKLSDCSGVVEGLFKIACLVSAGQRYVKGWPADAVIYSLSLLIHPPSAWGKEIPSVLP